jgi:hypothetical protein
MSLTARLNFIFDTAKVRRIFETRVNISENLSEKANFLFKNHILCTHHFLQTGGLLPPLRVPRSSTPP